MAASDGRWLIVTESGFFTGSLGSDALINVVSGFQSRPASQFRDQLYRSDLVDALLSGDHEGRYNAGVNSLIWRKFGLNTHNPITLMIRM